ncbi:sigma-70 family RNA polymerase sigma factor [Metabacillus iocasae]|uniref:RNA polymerase sigma-70 factor (ECF subfamily) n=1 Tax=Priestia iocasae TaxID=2291674 RepID=A0ABS2QTL5_9BACI|nr:sigma-70 family RNA polymerase sigma factor [Metabacillus iocasae]MBM7702806.1 RNA polymerase sigma-70 factor (ECF subfamily) [Metabacillus iocasae]
MNISELVKHAQKGDDEAFEQLIATVRHRLYKTAYLYVRNEQDALDLYQDAIYQAYLSLKTLKNREHFQAWIVKIVANKAIDFIRKSSKQFIANSDSFSHLCSVDMIRHVEHSLDLTAAFAALDHEQKTLILLRYYYDLPVKEISKLTNSPEGTIKSSLHRAKKTMRPILKEGYLHG